MSTGYRVSLPDGRQIHTITLTSENGRWLGNVVLEYDNAKRWGRYYSITDYGDYGYEWRAVGGEGFEGLLIESDNEYMINKLSNSHDEARVCDIDTTVKELEKLLRKRWRGNRSVDADCLGDALDSLRRVENEPELWAWQSDHHMLVEPDDLYDCIVQGPGRLLKGYEAHILPALKSYLREASNEQVV